MAKQHSKRRQFLATALLGPAGLVLALLVLAFSSGPAAALTSPWLDHEQAKVRLIAAGDGQASEELRLGLQFSLQPGWKIYWRTPGEAGIPPVLDWSESENLASAEMRWPVPYRFTLFGIDTFGYDGEVVLPIQARAVDPGQPVNLRAQLTYLICSDICIPYDGQLALALPAGGPPPSAEGFLISQAERLVPGDGSSAGLALDSSLLVGEAQDPVLEVVARSEIPFEAPDLLVEGPPGYLFAAPQVDLSEDGREAVLRLASTRGTLAEGVLEGKMLTLTLTDGQRGLEQMIVTRYGPGMTSPAAVGAATLLQMLALAVLGGLILNLMPCVLPVLSIKLLSVVKQGGRDRREVRVSFLASAAGILFSFLVLAGVAIALKAGGMAAGWGIQFQQPLFLTAMTVLLTLFACNLFGFFEIPLPRAIADLAGGQGQGHGLVGHFSTGAFATLLATPCSAPFLGTAVAFALARGAPEILLIFAALGLGLALPYLAVAAVPGLATRLPRPGPWMVTLRRVLGLALAGTAVWLLSVLAGQVSLTAAVAAGVLLLCLGLVLGFRARLKRPLGAVLAAILAVAVLGLPAGFDPAAKAQASTEEGWVAFDQAEIARRVAAGDVVFVDVTADWCLTCQVNKKLVIDTDEVMAAFDDQEVVRMRADWTLPSDEISAYLAAFGRYGIPFNVVYGPGAPGGETLPELLTVTSVLAATGKAAGGQAQAANP